jgi:DNA sulfur modification protein DndE
VDEYREEEREFNRYTLLGEYDALFMAMLKQRCHADGIAEDELPDYFRAHLNRGVTLLQQRTRGLSDILALVPRPEALH